MSIAHHPGQGRPTTDDHRAEARRHPEACRCRSCPGPGPVTARAAQAQFNGLRRASRPQGRGRSPQRGSDSANRPGARMTNASGVSRSTGRKSPRDRRPPISFGNPSAASIHPAAHFEAKPRKTTCATGCEAPRLRFEKRLRNRGGPPPNTRRITAKRSRRPGALRIRIPRRRVRRRFRRTLPLKRRCVRERLRRQPRRPGTARIACRRRPANSCDRPRVLAALSLQPPHRTCPTTRPSEWALPRLPCRQRRDRQALRWRRRMKAA